MRRRVFGVSVAVLGVAALGCVVDAWGRVRARDADDALHRAAARVVGPELALRSPSRHARHPTRAEPGAAMADGPSIPDADPAGYGSLGP